MVLNAESPNIPHQTPVLAVADRKGRSDRCEANKA